MDLAVAVGMPPERQIFHTIPQEFMIDQQTGIKDPLGLRGNRLSAKAHIVTGQVTSTENMVNCANNCGLSVADIILQPLASAEAVLSEDEKDLGVALVDIGGGTTDIAIFYCGSIQHTAVITKGGNDITQEISISLRTSTAEAEKIKRQYGCALTDLVIKDEFLDVPTVGKQKLVKCSRKYLAEIIQPSLEEIFNAVHEQILNSGFADLLTSGVVITGGSTMLEGMPQLSEKVLELQTRRGIPNKVDGLSDLVSYPIYSTGVGLVQYGLYNHSAYPPIPLGRPVTETIINRLKSFISSWGIFGHK